MAMVFLFTDKKWKVFLVLVLLFAVASFYLYSTDPSVIASPAFQDAKASVIKLLNN